MPFRERRLVNPTTNLILDDKNIRGLISICRRPEGVKRSGSVPEAGFSPTISKSSNKASSMTKLVQHPVLSSLTSIQDRDIITAKMYQGICVFRA